MDRKREHTPWSTRLFALLLALLLAASLLTTLPAAYALAETESAEPTAAQDMNGETADRMETGEIVEPEDPQETGDPAETEDLEQIEDPSEIKDHEEAEDPDETENIEETQDPKETEAPEETDDLEETEDPEDSEEAEDPEDSEEAEEAEEIEETPESGFAALSLAEQYAALTAMETDEDWYAAFSSLSEEAQQALFAYMRSLYSPPVTVNRTGAGPFRPPVTVQASARKNAARRTAGGYADTEGIETVKTVAVNGDGTYTITLESWTTGQVTTQSSSIPADIVLVLDVTGSMREGFAGAADRMDALRRAAGAFIDQVYAKYSASCDSRVAIVSFADSASTLAGLTPVDDAGHTSLRAITDGLGIRSGHTQTHTGIQQAERLLTGGGYTYSGPNAQRSKVVVVLTDGEPYNGSNPYFDTASANSAVQAAYRLKSAGVTVYTVGIFNGADPSIWRAADIPAGGGVNKGTSTLTWNGSSYSVPWWEGDSKNAGLPQGYNRQISYSLIAPYNANIFCNYLSSNMPGASTLSMNGDGTLSNYRIRFRVNPSSMFFEKSADGYYLTADNAASLESIFQSISQQIESQDVNLGAEAVVQDVLAPCVSVPEGARIALYTVEKTADGWAERQEAAGLAQSYDAGEKVLRVTGFDYNRNFVSESPKEDGSRGRKLIVEFTVALPENFLGGSAVATNDNLRSGVFAPDGEGGEQLLETFVPSPETVAVPLRQIAPESTNRNVYLGAEVRLAELFNTQRFTIVDGGAERSVGFNELFDGVNNACVNVRLELLDEEGTVAARFTVPAGVTTGDWTGDAPTLGGGRYRLRCVVEDSLGSGPSAQTLTGAEVRVFTPVLCYTDRTADYGGPLAVSALQPDELRWVCGETRDKDVTMDSPRPELTYAYSLADGRVERREDYPVGLTAVTAAGRNLLELPGAVRFLRSCETEELSEVPAEAETAFVIHVRTATLSVKKAVEGLFANKTADYAFTLTVTPPAESGLEPVEESFTLADGGERSWTGLPPGAAYTLTETGLPAGMEVYIGVDGAAPETRPDGTASGVLDADETVLSVVNRLDSVPTTGLELPGGGVFAFVSLPLLLAWGFYMALKRRA